MLASSWVFAGFSTLDIGRMDHHLSYAGALGVIMAHPPTQVDARGVMLASHLAYFEASGLRFLLVASMALRR